MVGHFTKQPTAVYVIYEPMYTTIFNLPTTDFRSKNNFVSRVFTSSCESCFILLKTRSIFLRIIR